MNMNISIVSRHSLSHEKTRNNLDSIKTVVGNKMQEGETGGADMKLKSFFLSVRVDMECEEKRKRVRSPSSE